MISEFKNSKKDIYIQLHDDEKQNINFSKSGRFIIQFLTFKKNQIAETIRNEWEKKNCIQSTSIDYEKNIVGDQKYFDELYLKYSENFCISENFDFFQAPWTSKSQIIVMLFYTTFIPLEFLKEE